MDNLPEEIKHRKVRPAQLTCPDRPQEDKYKPNKPVRLEECRKCRFHRGYNDGKVACAWKKGYEDDE
jgi:hypothetical protein